jgi:adenine-specific DNA-methyltransferase
MDSKHKLGQFFTTNEELKEKIYEFILNSPDVILEPSIGRGDLVSFIQQKIPCVSFDTYEIDESITILSDICTDNIIYTNFITYPIKKKYATIIGNPPYVRTKKGNLYLEFIDKCYNLLEDSGELIFIVPADFLKLTSAVNLLNIMMTNGTFTHIFHPNNEHYFEGASIDIIIFRYCKDITLVKQVRYNNNLLYLINNNGLITFSEEEVIDCIIFQDYFEIYVGLVSGKEKVYKNKELGNIAVLNGLNKVEKYIYINSFPCEDDKINEYLLIYKEELIARSIRKFDNRNWYEWGAPRNIKTIQQYLGKECIYIYNLTRQTPIAFLGNVNYFGGNLLMILPKKPCDLDKILSYLNSKRFIDNFMFSGRFKIGQRQLCNTYIPKEFI